MERGNNGNVGASKQKERALLGQWAHTFLILGMMLGGGTFGIVRELAQLVGTHLWMPFAVAGVIITMTSESMAYLISEHPGAGSHTRRPWPSPL